MSGEWQTLCLAIVKTEAAAEMVEAEDTLVVLAQGQAQQLQPAQPKPRPTAIYQAVHGVCKSCGCTVQVLLLALPTLRDFITLNFCG
jgi:hypothetical protein